MRVVRNKNNQLISLLRKNTNALIIFDKQMFVSKKGAFHFNCDSLFGLEGLEVGAGLFLLNSKLYAEGNFIKPKKRKPLWLPN